MEVLSSVIFSGVLYDILKHTARIGVSELRVKLKDWIIDERTLSAIAEEVNSLDISSELSESAIEMKINQSPRLTELMGTVQKANIITINQSHSGHGDNVAGNKIIN